MKKMLYSTMLLAALMNCYSMMEATGRNGGGVYHKPQPIWLGGDTDSWSPYAEESEQPEAKKFESRARVQPAMGKIAYEKLTPIAKAELLKQTVEEIKMLKNELENQGRALSPSAHTQIKRTLERAEAVERELLAQVRPSEVKNLKTSRTLVSVDDDLTEKSNKRLESASDIADNLKQLAPVRLSVAANDAMSKAQTHADKVVRILKKAAA